MQQIEHLLSKVKKIQSRVFSIQSDGMLFVRKLDEFGSMTARKDDTITSPIKSIFCQKKMPKRPLKAIQHYKMTYKTMQSRKRTNTGMKYDKKHTIVWIA